MELKQESEDLVSGEKEIKDVFAKGYYASATFFNDLPPHWQVDIIQEGCKFVDDDGNNDNKAAYARISAGRSYTLRSTYNGCCRMYFVVMKAQAANGEEWNLLNSTTVEAGYCGGNLKWHLVPESRFVKGSATEAPPFRLVLEEIR